MRTYRPAEPAATPDIIERARLSKAQLQEISRKSHAILVTNPPEGTGVSALGRAEEAARAQQAQEVERLRTVIQRQLCNGWHGMAIDTIPQPTDDLLRLCGEDITAWPRELSARELFFMDDKAIIKESKMQALWFRRVFRDASDAESMEILRETHYAGVKATGFTYGDQQRQLCDPRFWSRQLRKIQWRGFEHLMHCKHLIGGLQKQKYCSNFALVQRNQRLRANNEFMAHTYMHDGDGNVICLADVAITPERLAAQRLAIIKGMQDTLCAAGYGWVMLTMTAPPHFHPTPMDRHRTDKADKVNAWELAGRPGVREANEYISEGWSRMRSMLWKRGGCAGIRIIEPHGDGCPHWHVLIFYDGVNVTPTNILNALDRHFPWQRKQKKRMVVGDDRKGSAVGYMLKYLTKHTRCAGSGQISANNKKNEKNLQKALEQISRRVDAYRGCYGGHSFQPFGLPSGAVSKWKAIGRLRDRPSDYDAAVLYAMVKSGDFGSFAMQIGNFKPLRKRDATGSVEAIHCRLIKEEKRTVGVLINDWRSPIRKKWQPVTDTDLVNDAALAESIENLAKKRADTHANSADLSGVTLIHNNPSKIAVMTGNRPVSPDIFLRVASG